MLFKKRHFLKLYAKHFNFFYNTRSSQQLVSIVDNVPKYPPIIDTSEAGLARHERQLCYDRIKSLPTVEQKLYAMIENRKAFHFQYMMSPCPPSYLAVPFHSYITRTHVIQGLPEIKLAVNLDNDFERLKSKLSEIVAKNVGDTWRKEKVLDQNQYMTEAECGSKMANDLLVAICGAVGFKYPHLQAATFDPRPRVQSYWYHGGFTMKKKDVDYENMCFQFSDYPYFTVRIEKPLIPVVPIDDPLCETAAEVPHYPYHPQMFGYAFKRYKLTCVPGTWPGVTPTGFPLLQIHTSDKVNKLTDNLEHYNHRSVEEAYGVLASFGWMNAIATYQGFTPYHDLTYPIVGQTILTNGQDWSFFIYQLNTITFHDDLDQKDRRNLMWCSPKMRLFETIEDGEPKGINEEVLKTFMGFVLYPMATPTELNLRPYLGEDTRSPEEVLELRTELLKLCRNRVRKDLLQKQKAMWIKIYKDHPDAPPCPSVRLE